MAGLTRVTNNVDNTYYVDKTTKTATNWTINVPVSPLYPYAFGNATIRGRCYSNDAESTLVATINSVSSSDGTKYAMGADYVRTIGGSLAVSKARMCYMQIVNTGSALTRHTPPPITNQIANTTASGAGVTYKGYKVTVIFTRGAADPDTEYKATYYRYNTSTKEFETVEAALTLNDDGTLTVVCDFPQWDDPDHPITLSGGTPAPVEGSVTNKIDGTDMEYTKDGTTLAISLAPSNSLNTYYRYYNVQLSYTNTAGVVKTIDVPADNSATLTISVADYDSTKDATVTGAFEASVLITGSFANCSVAGLNEYYRLTDTLNVTLTANEGDEFGDSDRPTLSYHDKYNASYVIDCVISEDKTTATFSTDVLSSYNIAVYLSASGGATPVTVIRQYGTVNYYRVTLDQLDAFAQKRFFIATLSGESSQVQSIDLGDYVTQLKRLYCDVPTYGTDTIQCGNYNTKVEVATPKSDVLTLDFGSITLPAYNSSSLDFQTEFTLYAPFVGNISIPSDWAGRSLGLKYIVNTFMCQAVCVLSIDGNEIEHRECEPATNLYYVISNSMGAIGDDNYTVSYLSGLEPYLLVKHWTAMPAYINSTADSVKLGEVTGFVALDSHYTPPISGALGDEIDELTNLLHSGVYMR